MPIHPNTRRCNHLKVDGSRCGSPALTGKPKCHFHNHIFRAPKEFVLPPLEDANAIQVGVMEVMRALVDDRLEREKAGTLLYALQIAQSNLRNISLAPARKTEAEERDEMSLAEILLNELRSMEEEDEQEKAKSATSQSDDRTHSPMPRLESVSMGPRTG